MTLGSRAFARYRGSYVDIFGAAFVGFVHVLLIPGYSAMLFPYFQATFEEYLRIVFAFEVALLPGSVATLLIFGRGLSSLTSWLREPIGTRPPAALWGQTVGSLPKITLAAGLTNAALCVPPSVYTANLVGLSPFGFLLYVAFLAIMISAVVAFGYLLAEQWLRPPIAELASWLPAQGSPPPALITLGTKLLVLVPAINLFTGMTVAAVSTNTLGIEGRLGVTVATTLLITLTFSLGLSLMLRRSLLQRLQDLRGAIHDVDSGDLDAAVPYLAGDEIDDVGHSFNQMVAGLREREELREANIGLVDDLQASRARIVAASDEARRQVERDLHDGAQQNLVLLNLKLGLVERQLDRDPVAAARLVADSRADLNRALSEIRDLAHGIYPQALTSDGIAAALEDAGSSARLKADNLGRYTPEIEAAVYFCCLEALQNASKYAGEGANVEVRLSEARGDLQFDVTDDGPGFDPAAVNGSTGLQNMSDRMGALGGTVEVSSTPGWGTTVRGTVRADHA